MTQSDSLAEPITHKGTIFRKTNVHRGRKVFITPQNSTMQYLCYARTILDQSTPEAGWENGTHETALILLSGEAEVAVGADRLTLFERDSVYIPRGAAIED
jgi:5-deoxy-D-glucuronate isomerase